MYPIIDNKIKILFVEDNSDVVEVDSMLLNSLGFETHSVDDGNLAIKTIEEYKPNMVILDLELKRGTMTGDQVQEEIFKHPDMKGMPVIVKSVHLKNTTDPENLGKKYMAVHRKYTGRPSERFVQKFDDQKKKNNEIKDMMIEVTLACTQDYRVMPTKLKAYWEENDPEVLSQFILAS